MVRRCVYLISFENGEKYVGSTKNFEKRIKDHGYRKNDKKYQHMPLYKCLLECKEYTYTKLEELECDKNEIFKLEQKFIKELNPSLNCRRSIKPTIEEYRTYNNARQKRYREEAIEKFRAKGRKKYYEHKDTILSNLKVKVTCECGSIVAKGALWKHKKSKKHINYFLTQ